MSIKEDKLAELLADGYTEADLTWVPAEAPVDIDLVYLQGEDPQKALAEALARQAQGQWLIKAEAVERRIQALPGCANRTLAEAFADALTLVPCGVVRARSAR